jgi:hypothetical protein
MMARCCGGLAGSSSSCGLARAARMVFDLLGFSGEDQGKWNSMELVEAGPDPQMHRVVRGRCMDLKRVLTDCRSS